MSQADGWQRLHPLTPVVRAGRVVPAFILLLIVGHSSGDDHATSEFFYLGVIALSLVLGVVSWLVTRWRLDAATLVIESGLLRRSSRRLPLARLQAVDVVEPLLARVFGLAELRIRLAGSSRVDGRLAYLDEPTAVRLRERLLVGQQHAEPEVEPPENALLATVQLSRLVGAVFLSGTWAFPVAVVLGLTIFYPGHTEAIIGSSTAFLFYIALGLWRRVSTDYGFSVAHTDDGLRIRSGLLQTVTETIPRARIQSIRRIEPLLWRPLGWCRLEISVASGQKSSGGRDQSRRLTKALLPVGSRTESDELLRAVLGTDLPVLERPPRRAFVRSPLRCLFLECGVNDDYALAVTGRICRRTCYVPLSKAQSVRRVQGPIERLLGLSSVMVDVAGRHGGASMLFRGIDDAGELFGTLVRRSRAARLRVGEAPGALGRSGDETPGGPTA
ncbi:MAG TPA: PH domain-containing protein [Acidimicrobiales bacterium]